MMALLLLAYAGGFLTILSPCILPVLPFVFARSEGGFVKSHLPVLAGLAATFTAVSALAIVGGAWAGQANQWGRDAALVLMAAFALSLLFPDAFDRIMSPITSLGSRLSAQKETSRPGSAFVIGIATGFLWAPCAGPILGLILTAAATQKNVGSAALFLFTYALGACTSLGLALTAGGKFFGRMKKLLKTQGRVKKIAGVFVLLGVVAIAFNWDRTILTKVSRFQTEGFEQKLIDLVSPEQPHKFGNEGRMPEFRRVTQWLNSAPLSPESLKGKVVLVDFWTYSCINCLRTLPYIKAWAEKYKSAGLVVIGVHTPEFGFEEDVTNVEKAVRELGLTYPIAIDNDYAVWTDYGNRYWPAHYFIDREGQIREHHFGEGDYAESEKTLQELLGESGQALAQVEGQGVQAAPSSEADVSPETYLGYAKVQNFQSVTSLKKDTSAVYTSAPAQLKTDQWALEGSWKIEEEAATLTHAPGRIFYRFRGRDLNLVLGPADEATDITYQVRVDGQEPGENAGADVDAQGRGHVKDQRLYQLLRLKNTKAGQHTFEIEFNAPGVQAFAFTFG